MSEIGEDLPLSFLATQDIEIELLDEHHQIVRIGREPLLRGRKGLREKGKGKSIDR